LRSRPDYGHVALEDVEQLGKFVKAGGAEELAVGIQANIVREQVAVGVLFVRHRTELDELEDFFVKARARLREEWVATHHNDTQDCEHNENRAQAEDGRQSAEEVKDSLEEVRVHQATTLDPSLRSG